MGIKPRKKRPLRLPGIIAGVLILFWLSSLLHWQPGEGALVRRFQKNRAAFEELKAIVSTNRPVTAEQAVHQGVNAWSVNDYQRYRKLLKQTGVIRVTQKDNEIRFMVVDSRSGKKGPLTAVAWRDTNPEVLIELLKDFHKTGSEPAQAYRRLEENWYLWVQK